MLNNEQFRRLVTSSATPTEDGSATTKKSSEKHRSSFLGSRHKPGATITPRAVGGNPFRKADTGKDAGRKTKEQRLVLPKGTKLAGGFVDRAQRRREEEEEAEDEDARKIEALEKQLQEEEIDQETFERLRDEITGGDLSKTHLVKGLDRRLLERVKAGEDVLAGSSKSQQPHGGSPVDEDAELDELEKHEVVATEREVKIKVGEKAKIPPPVAGQKRSRDQILAELKAQREAAKAAARPQLGTGFKKIRKEEGPRVEIDEKGREVLITTDQNGNVKRKIKKSRIEPGLQEDSKSSRKETRPLGADVNVPTFEPLPAEDSDGDIFENAGHDFDPLAGLDSDDEALPDAAEHGAQSELQEGAPRESQDTTEDKPQTVPRTTQNYFNDDPKSFSVLGNIKNDLSDPNVIAALAQSRRLDTSKLSETSQAATAEEEARRKRREAMLANQDRDMEDMDMGFGGSRFDDAEEMAMDGTKVKLSKWRGLGDDGEDDGDEGGGGGTKRKRGPKKKKGDKNSAADVLRAMESQRKP